MKRLNWVVLLLWALLQQTRPVHAEELMIYAGIDPETIKVLENEFSLTHPEINLKYFRLTTSSLVSRIAVEYRAGKLGADVVIGNLDMLTQLPKKLFRPYRSPEVRNFKEKGYDQESYWTVLAANAVGLLYNTRMHNGNEKPHNWEELSNPTLKGQLIVEENSAEIYAGLQDYFGLEKARTITKGMLANAVSFKGQRQVVMMLLAGEAPLALGYTYSVVTRPEAPIAFQKKFEPLILKESGIFLTEKARNNPAAETFVSWCLSKSVQETITLQMGRISLRKDLGVKTKFITPR